MSDESRHEIESVLNIFDYLFCPFIFKYICHLMSVLDTETQKFNKLINVFAGPCGGFIFRYIFHVMFELNT